MLSRRSLTAVLGLSTAGLSNLVEAKRKRKRNKKKQIKRNEFGCVGVGKYCKNHGQCCAGICGGKQGKRKCRAHGTGTCDQEGPGLCTSPNPELLKCNNSADCACIRTTAGSSFCFSLLGGDDCADCQTDADCAALGFPLGSACAPVSEGGCAGNCPGGMSCEAPCGYVPPVP